MKPKESTGNFELLEPGSYVARCYQLIHLGKVDDSYQDKPRKTSKVWIGFELPTEKREFTEGKGEQPFAVNKEFTNSSSESGNLFKFMKSWSPKITKENFGEFDLNYVMGESCMIGIGHKTSKNGIKRMEITSIGPVPKDYPIPEVCNPQFSFDIDEGFDQEKFNQLPKFMRDKMVTSEEFKALNINENEVESIAAESRGETQRTPSNQPEQENNTQEENETPVKAEGKKGKFF